MSHCDVRSKQQAATKNNKWHAIKVIQRRDKKTDERQQDRGRTVIQESDGRLREFGI